MNELRTLGTADAAAKRIVLVDDHPIVRDGLKQMIQQDPQLTVCGEASGASDALTVVADTHPDLVLVDVFLDGINGIELTKMLCERQPSVQILILSMHDETLYAERAIRAGARGYVMKQEASRTILTAIHTVLNGELFISEAMRSSITLPGQAEHSTATDTAPVVERLSSRELGVFEAIGEGLDRTEIADKLKISIKTVETHRANIKYKLNVESVAGLVDCAKAWLRQHRQK